MRKSGIATGFGVLASYGVAALILSVMTAIPPELRADINPATGEREGDVSIMNFDDYCRGDLPQERQSRFFSAFEVANSALASNNIEAAEDAFGEARGAAYRGGADSDISIKCLGEATAGRWFDAQLDLSRRRSAIDGRGSEQEMAALYVTAVEQDAEAIVEAVGRMRPRRYVASIGTLEQIVTRIDNERAFGAFILSKENDLARACREALIQLRRKAALEHRNALRMEEESFSRPISDEEIEVSDSVNNIQALAKAMTGVDLSATWDREAIIVEIRANESREYLRSARIWNLEIYADRQLAPSSERAKSRGDGMLSRAEDTSSSLPLRDALYQEAQRYYDFGGFREASASATAAHESIEPALQAERDRQDRLLEAARARIDKRAESVRQAVEDMAKSEAEKKSFEAEADAMEDELGF
jgi:hypothetical protein